MSKELSAQDLECPVCMTLMESPIAQCDNAHSSHSVCGACRAKLAECPLCKGAWSSSRNEALEEFARSFPYPCPNLEQGCASTVLLQQRDQHVQVCPHRLYECLPRKDDGCEWRGKFVDLDEHMAAEHRELLTHEEFPAKIHLFFELAINSVRLAKLDDDLFWIHIRQDPTTSKYFRGVQYIGPAENASKYEFSYEFDLMDDTSSSITYKRKVYSELDDMTEEFNKNANISNMLGFARKCGFEKESVVCVFNIRKIPDEE